MSETPYSETFAQMMELLRAQSASHDSLLLACRRYGAMEAAVANLTSPGDRVLALGAQNAPWASIARAFNCEVDTIDLGRGFASEAVRRELRLETRAVFVTGTEHCAALRSLMDEVESEAMLAIAADAFLAAAPQADVLVAETEIAGLSLVAVNARAWDRMEATYNPRSYFDLRRERRNAGTPESLHRPTPDQLAALLGQLRHSR